MRGKKARALRKLAGFHPKKNRMELRTRVSGEERVGIIDGTGKGNHRVENRATYTWIAGPRRRLYKLMKRFSNNPIMMQVLIDMEKNIDKDLTNKQGE